MDTVRPAQHSLALPVARSAHALSQHVAQRTPSKRASTSPTPLFSHPALPLDVSSDHHAQHPPQVTVSDDECSSLSTSVIGTPTPGDQKSLFPPHTTAKVVDVIECDKAFSAILADSISLHVQAHAAADCALCRTPHQCLDNEGVFFEARLPARRDWGLQLVALGQLRRGDVVEPLRRLGVLSVGAVAAAAGLAPGDRLISINGTAVPTTEDFFDACVQQLKFAKRRGRGVSLGVHRPPSMGERAHMEANASWRLMVMAFERWLGFARNAKAGKRLAIAAASCLARALDRKRKLRLQSALALWKNAAQARRRLSASLAAWRKLAIEQRRKCTATARRALCKYTLNAWRRAVTHRRRTRTLLDLHHKVELERSLSPWQPGVDCDPFGAITKIVEAHLSRTGWIKWRRHVARARCAWLRLKLGETAHAATHMATRRAWQRWACFVTTRRTCLSLASAIARRALLTSFRMLSSSIACDRFILATSLLSCSLLRGAMLRWRKLSLHWDKLRHARHDALLKCFRHQELHRVLRSWRLFLYYVKSQMSAQPIDWMPPLVAILQSQSPGRRAERSTSTQSQLEDSLRTPRLAGLTVQDREQDPREYIPVAGLCFDRRTTSSRRIDRRRQRHRHSAPSSTQSRGRSSTLAGYYEALRPNAINRRSRERRHRKLEEDCFWEIDRAPWETDHQSACEIEAPEAKTPMQTEGPPAADWVTMIQKVQALQRGVASRKATKLTMLPLNEPSAATKVKLPAAWLTSPAFGRL